MDWTTILKFCWACFEFGRKVFCSKKWKSFSNPCQWECLGHLAANIQILCIQIFGDSKLVFDCLKLDKPPRNIYLLPFYKDITRINTHFQWINYMHTYRERNHTMYQLSKHGLLLPTRTMEKWVKHLSVSTLLSRCHFLSCSSVLYFLY